jgi:hypothetical protein
MEIIWNHKHSVKALPDFAASSWENSASKASNKAAETYSVRVNGSGFYAWMKDAESDHVNVFQVLSTWQALGCSTAGIHFFHWRPAFEHFAKTVPASHMYEKLGSLGLHLGLSENHWNSLSLSKITMNYG